MHRRRVKESFFDEDSNLHIKIQWHTVKITEKLKSAESKLKELINAKATEKSDEQIRRNMQSILAQKLK